LTKPGWSKPHTHSNPSNLALFGHKITLYRFNHGAHTIAGGSNRSRGLSPPSPLTLTTAFVGGSVTPHPKRQGPAQSSQTFWEPLPTSIAFDLEPPHSACEGCECIGGKSRPRSWAAMLPKFCDPRLKPYGLIKKYQMQHGSTCGDVFLGPCTTPISRGRDPSTFQKMDLLCLG